MRSIASLFCLMFGSVVLLAQTSRVSGQVSSPDGPLPGATVQISDTDIAVSTDAEGKYLIEDVPPGEHVIRVRFVGFESVKQEVSVTEEQVNVPVIEMRPSQLLLDEMVVTGTMKSSTLRDSPVKIEVLDMEFIDQVIPSASGGLMQNIQLVNGVQEVVACGVCYTNNISINGLDGAHTAILIDGMPMFGNLASVYALDGISNLMIDRIEVVKGPSSTLYGSEAVAGVINIITKDAEGPSRVDFDLMIDEAGDRFVNASWKGNVGKHQSLLAVNGAQRLGFHDDNEDDFGDVVLLDRVSLFNKWNFQRESGKELSIAAQAYYEDRRNGLEEFLTDRRYRDLRGDEQVYGESIFTERVQVFGRYELPVKEDVRLDFSLSNHEQDSYYGADHYTATQRIAFANLLWSKDMGKHQLLSGITQRFQYYQDNTTATQSLDEEGVVRNRPATSFIPGVFLQDEWQINEAWSLLSGARLDHYQEHGAIFSPRLNLRWKASDWTTLRFNSGTGFRVVNLFTEDHAFVTGQRDIIIDEALRPEESVSASFDLQHIYQGLGGDGSIGLEMFYTQFSNRILPDYEQAGAIIYDNLDGTAISRGVSISIDHRLGRRSSVRFGGQWMDNFQQEFDEEGTLDRSDIEFAPEWSGLWAWRYQLGESGWTFAYSGNLTGPMQLPEVFDVQDDGSISSEPRPTRSPWFSLHHLRIEKAMEHWTIYAGARNLFDYRQEALPVAGHNDPNAPAGFSEAFDTAYTFAPLMGRRAFIGIQWNITGASN